MLGCDLCITWSPTFQQLNLGRMNSRRYWEPFKKGMPKFWGKFQSEMPLLTPNNQTTLTPFSQHVKSCTTYFIRWVKFQIVLNCTMWWTLWHHSSLGTYWNISLKFMSLFLGFTRIFWLTPFPLFPSKTIHHKIGSPIQWYVTHSILKMILNHTKCHPPKMHNPWTQPGQAYRLEPSISRSMAKKKPAHVPYHKGGWYHSF